MPIIATCMAPSYLRRRPLSATTPCAAGTPGRRGDSHVPLQHGADVAGKIIQTIRDTRRRGDELLSELVRALEDENSRLVRIAAAITLAEWKG